MFVRSARHWFPELIHKRFLPFLLAFVLPLVAVYAWWGGFNRVLIDVQMRGPYTYAYVEHTGDYAKLADRLARVGYLVATGSAVPASLQIDSLPARRVLVARVRAAMLLAPSRAYQALDDYLRPEGKSIAIPAVEIYEASGSVLRPGLLAVEVNSP